MSLFAEHVLPRFPSDKGFDVQIHWYIFWRNDGDADAAWQVLGTGVHNMALTLKYSLSKDEHGTDNCLCTGDLRIIIIRIRHMTGLKILSSTATKLHHLELKCWAPREPSGPL